MELIVEFLVQFTAWIIFEHLCKYTGAFLLWLYHHNSTFNLTHFFYKKDEKKAFKTGQIGCIFYVIVIIVCIIAWKI